MEISSSTLKHLVSKWPKTIFHCNEIARDYCKIVDDPMKSFDSENIHPCREYELVYLKHNLVDFEDIFNNQLQQWNTSHTVSENQFDEQTLFPILSPLFEFKSENKLLKYDKTMLVSSCKPDLFVRLNFSKSAQIDFFVVKIKKPAGNVYNQCKSGFVKVHREMKHLVDLQIGLGMDDPVSYIILVESEFLGVSHNQRSG
ncbi:hypothetical protein K501DRAFT_274275 [Backusella circina FSU 941]|nr:hypothetical protein K501DRAFT_274275 [Backusella circina FSU 941]